MDGVLIIDDEEGVRRALHKALSKEDYQIFLATDGQAAIDKMINGGLSGSNFSNSEMLVMQAGMYKYTQELELVGKVVEKATTGLKDTLKTQV